MIEDLSRVNCFFEYCFLVEELRVDFQKENEENQREDDFFF